MPSERYRARRCRREDYQSPGPRHHFGSFAKTAAGSLGRVPGNPHILPDTLIRSWLQSLCQENCGVPSSPYGRSNLLPIRVFAGTGLLALVPCAGSRQHKEFPSYVSANGAWVDRPPEWDNWKERQEGESMPNRNLVTSIAVAAIVCLSLVSISACGKDETTLDEDTVLPESSANAGEAPIITPPAGPPPTTLMTKDVIVGNGSDVIASSTITVHYTLMAWSTGQVVESSWAGGQPATDQLANLIAGWQQGLPGAKVGGRRLLVIPPDLGYGASGAEPIIGPNETLIFVVDIIAVE